MINKLLPIYLTWPVEIRLMRHRFKAPDRYARVSKIQKVKKIIQKSQMVLDILDARDIAGTRSLLIEEFAKKMGKVLIFVINKSDLVPLEKLKEEKRALSGIAPAYFIIATEKKGLTRLRDGIVRHAKKLPVKISLVGYPNVGKSQLANALKGKTAARVAPVPGHTKSIQWISVSKSILLFDSPGIVPLKDSEKSLALKGAVNVDLTRDPVRAAGAVLDAIRAENRESLLSVYNFEPSVFDLENNDILGLIAKKRGKLLPGGVPDLESAAKYILRDWYKGKLSKYRKDELSVSLIKQKSTIDNQAGGEP